MAGGISSDCGERQDDRRAARLYHYHPGLGVAADCAWPGAYTVHGRIRSEPAVRAGDWRCCRHLCTGNLVCVVHGRTAAAKEDQGTAGTVTAGEKATRRAGPF